MDTCVDTCVKTSMDIEVGAAAWRDALRHATSLTGPTRRNEHGMRSVFIGAFVTKDALDRSVFIDKRCLGHAPIRVA